MRAQRADVVSPAFVARYPAGSPQRVVAAWYRALQVGDDRTGAALYGPTAGMRTADVRLSRRYAAGFFAHVTLDRISDVSYTAGRATVFTVLTSRTTTPNGRATVTVLPQAFTLVKVGGAWRLGDNRFLAQAPRLAPKDDVP